MLGSVIFLSNSTCDDSYGSGDTDTTDDGDREAKFQREEMEIP